MDLRRIRIMLAVLLAALLPVAPAAGQQYPPAEGDLIVAGTVVKAGDPFPVSGDGFCPGATVTVTLQRADGTGTPRTLGTFTVDAQGRFSGSVTIPADTPPGTYDLRAAGQSSSCSVETRVLGARIEIEAGLARTGGDVLSWLLWAGASVALGVALLAAARRRRARTQREEVS